MKLKMDTQNSLPVLVVSEAIDSKQLPVLRAGVGKLLTSRGNLVLDLTAVEPQSLEQAEIVNALTSLRQSASAVGQRILIASSRAGLGDAATAAACAALIAAAKNPPPAEATASTSVPPAAAVSAPVSTTPSASSVPNPAPAATPELEEVELKKTLTALQAERAEANKILEARRAESDEMRKLQRENSQAKRMIRLFDREITAQMKIRGSAPAEMAAELKTKLIDVQSVLEYLTQSLTAGGKPGAAMVAATATATGGKT